MSEYVSVCEQAARAGGEVLQRWAGRFSVREKGPADLVTQADLESQQVIRSIVLTAYPHHGFLAEEEDGLHQPEGPLRWIVDPLDGTTNYVHQLPQYCVSVALARGKEVLAGAIFDPVSQECFTAAAGEGAFCNGNLLRVSDVTELSSALVAASFRPKMSRDSEEIGQFIEVLVAGQAVRRMGSSALNLAYLAAGRFDGYWALDTKSWDVAAGVLLVREAGGVVTDPQGKPFDLDRPRFAAAANATLHGQLCAALGRAN